MRAALAAACALALAGCDGPPPPSCIAWRTETRLVPLIVGHGVYMIPEKRSVCALYGARLPEQSDAAPPECERNVPGP